MYLSAEHLYEFMIKFVKQQQDKNSANSLIMMMVNNPHKATSLLVIINFLKYELIGCCKYIRGPNQKYKQAFNIFPTWEERI